MLPIYPFLMYVTVIGFGIIQGIQELVDGAEGTGRCIHTERYTQHDHVNLLV